jgi:hypothetical protein
MHLLKRLGILGLGSALLVVVGAGTAAAQTKEARGQVISVSDSMLTVKAGNQNMSFIVEPSTLVEASGASTRTRRAEAAGKESAGIKITDYVKAGSNVLVSYREDGGKNHALSVRPIASAGSGGGSPGAEAAKNVQGKVKSITGSVLTLEADGKDMTFAVDRDTDVLARGATAASKKAGGGGVPITDLVHNGDLVRVGYRDVNGSMKALEIQIRGRNTIPAK